MSKKIYIDSEKCIGCSLCAKTCKQSAIEMIDGKATVTRSDYCDKIGNCLPVCPVSAISFVENNEKIEKNAKKSTCPSSQDKYLKNNINENNNQINVQTQLKQWPVQIKLISENAQCFDGCDLLISADCTAFAYGNFHNEFMKDKVTLIGCPKLDMVDYAEKLEKILQNNDIRSVKVARMEVPCCAGIENAVRKSAQNTNIDFSVVTISVDGKIL